MLLANQRARLSRILCRSLDGSRKIKEKFSQFFETNKLQIVHGGWGDITVRDITVLQFAGEQDLSFDIFARWKKLLSESCET